LLALRIIQAIKEQRSIQIIKNMQQKLIHIRHPNLPQYVALAVESEEPLIKFLVVEEYIEPTSFLSLRTL